MALLRTIVEHAISVMIFILLAGVVISWLRVARVRVPYGNPLIRAIEGAAEAMLRPIRRAVPVTGGGLDFSPMIALMLLYILRGIIARIL